MRITLGDELREVLSVVKQAVPPDVYSTYALGFINGVEFTLSGINVYKEANIQGVLSEHKKFLEGRKR